MAVIPGTQFTELAPPAQTGQTYWSPSLASTGAEHQLVAGLERFGGAIAAYALNTIKQEIALEYSEKERMIDERGWAARNAVTGDEEADGKLWEKFQEDAQLIAGSSKYVDVNEELVKYINKVSPNWEQGIYTASLKKRRENCEDQFNVEYYAALEKGRFDIADKRRDEALKLGIITKTRHEELKKNAPVESHILIAERELELGNPIAAETELEKIKPEDLTTAQLKERNKLLGYGIKAAQEKKESAVLDIAFEHAVKGNFRSGIDEIVKERSNLGAKSFVDALNKYRNAFSILNDTGVNVYKETQNWDLYWEDLQKAIDGKITELEARRHVGSDGYSVTHFKEIKGILDGTSSKVKAFEDMAAVKNILYPMIEKMSLPIVGEITDVERIYMKEYAVRLFEDSVKNKDLTEREKREEAIRIYNKIEQMFRDRKFEMIKPTMLPGAKRPKRTVWKFGLEEIWDELTENDRRKAVELLDKGASPEQLIAHYKIKVK